MKIKIAAVCMVLALVTLLVSPPVAIAFMGLGWFFYYWSGAKS